MEVIRQSSICQKLFQVLHRYLVACSTEKLVNNLPLLDAPQSGFDPTRGKPASWASTFNHTHQPQPLEPVLFPRSRNFFADFPYQHCSINIEAVRANRGGLCVQATAIFHFGVWDDRPHYIYGWGLCEEWSGIHTIVLFADLIDVTLEYSHPFHHPLRPSLHH